MKSAKEWNEHVERSRFEWWKGNGPTIEEFVRQVQADALQFAADEANKRGALTDDRGVERAMFELGQYLSSLKPEGT